MCFSVYVYEPMNACVRGARACVRVCVCVCVCMLACVHACVSVLDVGFAVWLYIGCFVLFGLLSLLASVSTSKVKLLLSV